jgi:hypothetical protein
LNFGLVRFRFAGQNQASGEGIPADTGLLFRLDEGFRSGSALGSLLISVSKKE